MKKVVDCEPVGFTILVEILTAQEVLGTRLLVGNEQKVGAPQAYIRKIGPFVKEEKNYNFEVGDRVLLTGNYTPVPKMVEHAQEERTFGIVEPHAIKAVLKEGEEIPELLK
jgi:hypothetical protein